MPPITSAVFPSTICLVVSGCTIPGHTAQIDPSPPSEPLAVTIASDNHIPLAGELIKTLRVSAVYNDSHIQIRYEFPTDNPCWYHQYLVYEDGQWTRYGDASSGPDPHGLYEDRISMALDRGKVDGFAEFGGYVTMHPGVRSRSDAIDHERVMAESFFAETLNVDDVRKFLSASRHDPENAQLWRNVRSQEQLRELREAGAFLDTWQWRAHRSNPIGYADNGYVLDYRHSAEGQGMYTDNWDDDTDAPLWMFDHDTVGKHALRKETLLSGGYDQDDAYFIAESNAVPFDPDHQWQDGDVLPQRFLREPSCSRGAIRATGRWNDGAWHVRVTRTLDAPNALDSHALKSGETYHVQFAVHTNSTGARWHYVSMPLTLGMERSADLIATRVSEGKSLDEAESSWIELPIHYPGQATWHDFNGDDQRLRMLMEQARRDPTQRGPIEALTRYLVHLELRQQHRGH